MPQTPSERRQAQRRVARQLRRGENPLGGQFGRTAIRRHQEYLEIQQDNYERQAASQFARGEGVGEEIPLTYRPTKTTWPANGWKHRRTIAAGYDRETSTLSIQFFTNGAIYHYYDVTPETARAFRRAESPGRFINQYLNSHPYDRID